MTRLLARNGWPESGEFVEFVEFLEFIEFVGFVGVNMLTSSLQVGYESRDLSCHHLYLPVYLVEIPPGNVALIKGCVKLGLNFSCRPFGYEQELDELLV